MKKNILFLLVLIISVPICSQTTIETDSYGLDQYIEKCTDIPVVRKINGGTVFKITYEPEALWDNSMKGAFEYACKIWEEQLPNTLPINIHAKIGKLRGTNNGKDLLSKVSPTSYNYDGFEENLSTRIKYVVLAEYNTGHNATFINNITNEDFFNEPDITITYNENMLDNFSYSLYSTPVNKYDFVTLVLRDIAKGLGYMSAFTADNNIGAFHDTDRPLTYYESIIYNAIGTSDVYTAYTNSTQGTLPFVVPNYGTLNLYAPNIWQNGVSLNCFIPDSTKKITELLTYNFGKGTVIRDIVDDYNTLFQSLHGWQTYNLTTGFNEKSIRSYGTTDNLIPYNGTITLAQNSTLKKSAFNDNILYGTLNGDENSVIYNNGTFDLHSYLFPYDYKYPDNDGDGCWLVSLLKKDGTWDLVYRLATGTFNIPFEANMSDFKISTDHNQYQRTCDGYIRCRITHYKKFYDYLYHRTGYNITNHYYVLDYLPQRVNMGFVRPKTLPHSIIDNNYTKTIKINMSGLEGVDRIVVEQLDEGNELPIRFEVPDFKKGYFTAVVDKELYTQFVIFSYNKNGSTKSETLTIEPLLSIKKLYEVQIKDDLINLYQVSHKDIYDNTTFAIYPTLLNSIHPLKEGVIETPVATININGLKRGSYVLRIKSGVNSQKIKFIRQ